MEGVFYFSVTVQRILYFNTLAPRAKSRWMFCFVVLHQYASLMETSLYLARIARVRFGHFTRDHAH